MHSIKTYIWMFLRRNKSSYQHCPRCNTQLNMTNPSISNGGNLVAPAKLPSSPSRQGARFTRASGGVRFCGSRMSTGPGIRNDSFMIAAELDRSQLISRYRIYIYTYVTLQCNILFCSLGNVSLVDSHDIKPAKRPHSRKTV